MSILLPSIGVLTDCLGLGLQTLSCPLMCGDPPAYLLNAQVIGYYVSKTLCIDF